MAARVIEAALQDPPVTFALYGHPVIFAYPPFLVFEMARTLGLRVKVLPGVSALDCIFSELMIDPGTNGLQIYEATDLLLRRRPLQPDVPVLLWQIGAIETALYSNDISRPERFDRLTAYLLGFYPGSHIVYAVSCSVHPLFPSTVYRFPLEEIGAHSSFLNSGFTLYIPPKSIRPATDEQLARDVSDLAHLRRITHPRRVKES